MRVYSFFLILLQMVFFISSCGSDEGVSNIKTLNTDSPVPVVYWGSCDNSVNLTQPEKEAKQIDLNHFNQNTCREWYGDFFANINLQMTCKSIFGGQFTRDYCEDEKFIGPCIVSMENDSESRIYYETSQWSEASAKKHCSGYGSKSTWAE